MSFSCRTSDNKNLQIKPLLITKSLTKGSVVANIRKNVQDILVKQIESISYDTFINDLVSHKVQSYLKKALNKIYPLRVCEIRSMEIIDLEKREQAKNKAIAAKVAKQKPEKKAEESKHMKKEEKQGQAGEAGKEKAPQQQPEV